MNCKNISINLNREVRGKPMNSLIQRVNRLQKINHAVIEDFNIEVK